MSTSEDGMKAEHCSYCGHPTGKFIKPDTPVSAVRCQFCVGFDLSIEDEGYDDGCCGDPHYIPTMYALDDNDNEVHIDLANYEYYPADNCIYFGHRAAQVQCERVNLTFSYCAEEAECLSCGTVVPMYEG
jgi:hypothetical protein